MPWYSYGCIEGHVSEPLRRPYSAESETCSVCGRTADRLPFYGGVETHLPGESGEFEPDHERFLDRAGEAEQLYAKAEIQEGRPVKRPQWISAGIARARSRIVEGGSREQLRTVTEISGSINAKRKANR